jgi:hypothetical protein
MTALGKVLAFFVLLFSMVTCGLIVMVFLTRTNWRNAFENANEQTKVAVAALKAEQDKSKRDKDAADATIQDLQKQIAAKDRDNLGLKTQIKDLDARRGEQELKAGTEKANSEAATAEIEKLKLERSAMVATITARNTHINKLEKDIIDFRNRAVQAEINAGAQTAKNEKLMLRVEDQQRQLDDFKARGLVAGPNRGAAPPSVDVKGQVLNVDGNFATISLGRNHEIKEGDVLQVYRLSPAPTYLGTLKILRADVIESVGSFTAATRNAKIMKGDTVDTKVLGRN